MVKLKLSEIRIGFLVYSCVGVVGSVILSLPETAPLWIILATGAADGLIGGCVWWTFCSRHRQDQSWRWILAGIVAGLGMTLSVVFINAREDIAFRKEVIVLVIWLLFWSHVGWVSLILSVIAATVCRFTLVLLASRLPRDNTMTFIAWPIKHPFLFGAFLVVPVAFISLWIVFITTRTKITPR
jgi:hypothetical protein